MADIVPTNTEVFVCAGVPLDNKYNDTILFETAGAQQSYFSNKAIYKYNGHFTYQRVQNRVNNYTSLQTLPNPRIEFSCRIPVNADKIYNCNYLCFCNHYDTNKWWYCFIKEINYINPNCTEIIYEIDAIQTFLFNFKVGKSFVEREHTETDDYFEHVCLEDDIINGDETLLNFENISANQSTGYVSYYCICAPSTDVRNYAGAHGGTILNSDDIGKKMNGLLYIGFTAKSDALHFLEDLMNNGKADECVAIISFPSTANNGAWNIQPNNTQLRPTQLDGYTFHNKMLCSYPFRKFLVVGSGGESYEFRPQLFTGSGAPTFSLTKFFTGDDLLFSIKPNYQKNANKSKQIIISTAEMGAWGSSAFQTWLAQNKASLANGAMLGLVNMIRGSAEIFTGAFNINMGNAMGGSNKVFSGGEQISGVAVNIANAMHKPDEIHGTINSPSLDFELNETGFWFYEFCLNRQALERIDDYFERYGYKVNKIKIPTPFGNQQKRPLFNYVKTVDVNLTGSVPTPQMNIIKSAFDRGITFWHNENVGVYAKGANDV